MYLHAIPNTSISSLPRPTLCQPPTLAISNRMTCAANSGVSPATDYPSYNVLIIFLLLIIPSRRVPYFAMISIKTYYICLCDHPPHPQQATQPSYQNDLFEPIFEQYLNVIRKLRFCLSNMESGMGNCGKLKLRDKKNVESKNLKRNKIDFVVS